MVVHERLGAYGRGRGIKAKNPDSQAGLKLPQNPLFLDAALKMPTFRSTKRISEPTHILRTIARMWVSAIFAAPKLLLQQYSAQTLDVVFQQKYMNMLCHANQVPYPFGMPRKLLKYHGFCALTHICSKPAHAYCPENLRD